MKTLRWDLFYEIQHMETVADERTARLEARRNKWLLKTYPWLLLVIYLFAGMFVGWDGGIRPLLLLALFLPVLCNTLLSLRDGTLCTDEDHEGAQSSRIGAKIDLLVRPYFVFWYFFNLLLQGPTPSRWGWEMLLALAPATGCACLYWALAAMAHGHCLWKAQREGEEVPPPSRREGLAKLAWAVLLAASMALTVLGVRSVQQAAVPEELRPLENLTDPTWTVPDEGQVWVAACRVQIPDVPGVIAGETQGLVWLGQIDDTRYRVSLAIENGRVTAACRRRSVRDAQGAAWSDWSDERWQDGRWQNSLDLNLAQRSWAEQHIKASWTAPNLTDGQLLGWQAENGRYRLDRCDRVMLTTGAGKQTKMSNLPEEEQNHYFYTLDDAGRNIAYQRLSADGNGSNAWVQLNEGTAEELARQIEAPFVPDWYSEDLLPVWQTLPDAGT